MVGSSSWTELVLGIRFWQSIKYLRENGMVGQSEEYVCGSLGFFGYKTLSGFTGCAFQRVG